MTKFAEFPLRPHGQPWPGLKDSSSKLMRQGGEMSDCTNVIINQPDVLEKRKGFVRAFDERFGGVICGLFKYTDEFGRERIIVADETGFSVRSPFALPIFEQSDAYPFDDFNLANQSPIDADKWRNTSRYRTVSFQMRLRPTAEDGCAVADLPAKATYWFKEQLSRSYQVRINYDFNGTGVGQCSFVVIKAGPALTGALILGLVHQDEAGNRLMYLYRRTAGGVWILIGNALSFDGGDMGFFTVAYNQTTRVITATVVPTGAPIVTATSEPLTVIEDLDLGQTCGIGMGYVGDTVPGMGIAVVDGGPV